MSLSSNAKRFSSPTHSYASAHSIPNEKPNVYYDVVSAAGGNHFFRFVTEDGNEAPPELVNQVLPQIKTELDLFPSEKFFTVTLTAGSFLDEDQDEDICMDREVPDKLGKSITPDLNKREYDNLVLGKDDKPTANRTKMIQSSTSQLIQYTPQLTVSQSPKLRGILQAKHHSSTSSALNNDEGGHRVLHNVEGSSPSVARLKIIEPVVRFPKKKKTTSQTRKKALETMCQQYKAQLQQKSLEAKKALEQKEIVMKQNLRLLAKCEQLNVSLKDNEDSEVQELKSHKNEIQKQESETKELQNDKTQVQQKMLEAERAIEQNEFLTKQNETLLAKCEQLNVSLKKKWDLEAHQLTNRQKLNTELEKKEKEKAEVLENYRQKVAYLDRRVVGLETANTILEGRKEFPMKQNQILLAKCKQLNSSLKEKEESEAQQLQKHQDEVKKLNVELEKKDKVLENCTENVAVSNRKVLALERVKASLERKVKSLKKRTSKQQKVSNEKKKSVVNEETGPARPKRIHKEKDDPAFIYTLRLKSAKIWQKNVPYIIRKHLLPKVVENKNKGKTYLVMKTLENASKIYNPVPTRVYFIYSCFQESYVKLQQTLAAQGIKCNFIRGSIITEADLEAMADPEGSQTLIIIDDNSISTASSKEMAQVFTISRHKNCSVVLLLHFIFGHWPSSRIISANTAYFFLLKSPRMAKQVATLGSQLGKRQLLVSAYKRESKKRYGYILVDLRTITPEYQRIRTNVLNESKEWEIQPPPEPIETVEQTPKEVKEVPPPEPEPVKPEKIYDMSKWIKWDDIGHSPKSAKKTGKKKAMKRKLFK